jgi:hypothetical protein
MTTTLYSAHGNKHEATEAQYAAATTSATGSVTYTKTTHCHKCGGAGGYQSWPGFTCYRCGGCGIDPTPMIVTLYTEDGLAKHLAAEAKREAAAAKRAEKAAAKREANRQANLATARAQVGELFDEGLEMAGSNTFLQSLAEKAEKYGELSEKQVAAFQAAVMKGRERAAEKAKQKAVDAASTWVGEEGQRMTITAKVERTIVYVGTDYRGNAENKCITLMRDEGGNVLKYFGWLTVGTDSAGFKLSATEGETYTFKATVKKHDLYEGTAATILSRPAPIKQKATA